jgi:hypothetical protein
MADTALIQNTLFRRLDGNDVGDSRNLQSEHVAPVTSAAGFHHGHPIHKTLMCHHRQITN